ncbi:hypothetical protein [Myroides odoratus]|uniref:hypothetical protein n=1 Tax=Myroides odoratus TaxID=256 RepID=UPI001E2F998C|nr:hypothetical protein [Myroides odoratus]
MTKSILVPIGLESVQMVKRRLLLAWQTPTIWKSLAEEIDLLTVIKYGEKNKVFHILNHIVTRKTHTLTVDLPDSFEESGNVIWVFTTNEFNIECSTSMFYEI